jgi:hypothetical protein
MRVMPKEWFDPNRHLSKRWLYDVAYGCFESIGLVAAVLVAFDASTGTSDAEMSAYVVLVWINALTLGAAGTVGTMLSLFLWREWPLPLLGLMTALFWVVAVFDPWSEAVTVPCLLVYMASVVTAPLWWFFSRRKRLAIAR